MTNSQYVSMKLAQTYLAVVNLFLSSVCQTIKTENTVQGH